MYFKLNLDYICQVKHRVKEVPVKLMDGPSAAEMERGRASEMDRHTKCRKKNATNFFYNLITHSSTCPNFFLLNYINFSIIFIFVALCQSIHLRGMSSFHFCGTWPAHPFHRHFLH